MHRIGRTGRAGSTGVGITFVGSEQAPDVSKIAAELELDREFAASGHTLAPARSQGGGSGGGGRRGGSRSKPRSGSVRGASGAASRTVHSARPSGRRSNRGR